MIQQNFTVLAQGMMNIGECNVSLKDRHGKYLDANDIGLRSLGLSTIENVIGQKDHDFFQEAQAALMYENDQLVMQSNQAQLFHEKGDCVLGKDIIFRSYKMPFRFLSKKIIGVLCLSTVTKRQPKVTKKPLLSLRQKECLHFLLMGMSIKQIGLELSLSPRTVGHYLDAVKDKLDCSSRHELIKKGISLGFLIK
jgi:DNA-binding CsgD family transcriptional regulator